MGKSKRPWVYLRHKIETADEKHNVVVQLKTGKSRTKSFTKLSDAKTYAANRSRTLKLKSYVAVLPSGSREVKVSKKPRTKSSKRKRKDPFSLF